MRLGHQLQCPRGFGIDVGMRPVCKAQHTSDPYGFTRHSSVRFTMLEPKWLDIHVWIIYVFMYLCVYLVMYLFINLFIYLFMYLFIYLFIYVFIYLCHRAVFYLCVCLFYSLEGMIARV